MSTACQAAAPLRKTLDKFLTCVAFFTKQYNLVPVNAGRRTGTPRDMISVHTVRHMSLQSNRSIFLISEVDRIKVASQLLG